MDAVPALGLKALPCRAATFAYSSRISSSLHMSDAQSAATGQ